MEILDFLRIKLVNQFLPEDRVFMKRANKHFYVSEVFRVMFGKKVYGSCGTFSKRNEVFVSLTVE